MFLVEKLSLVRMSFLHKRISKYKATPITIQISFLEFNPINLCFRSTGYKSIEILNFHYALNLVIVSLSKKKAEFSPKSNKLPKWWQLVCVGSVCVCVCWLRDDEMNLFSVALQ